MTPLNIIPLVRIHQRVNRFAHAVMFCVNHEGAVLSTAMVAKLRVILRGICLVMDSWCPLEIVASKGVVERTAVPAFLLRLFDGEALVGFAPAPVAERVVAIGVAVALHGDCEAFGVGAGGVGLGG